MINELEVYLTKIKKEQGITKEQFAKKAKISRGYLFEVLAGKKLPRPIIAKRMSKATGGTVSAIEIARPFYA